MSRNNNVTSKEASFEQRRTPTHNNSDTLMRRRLQQQDDEEEEGSHSLARKVGMTASTLVETVSINYEDFTEGFLTCSTCLCTYDSTDHYPKLLHCSHTVCKSCLEKIASLPGVRESGSFRCPICRETIPLPRGGVITLPPSFLVNQLLDLMARQRREVIPKCSTHVSQELLFCETCDVVFCTICTQGSHSNGGHNGNGGNAGNRGSDVIFSQQQHNSPHHHNHPHQTQTVNNYHPHNQSSSSGVEHTVITFSIAIKRMSEILVYKGHQCIAKLNEAQDNVQAEMRKLDQNAEHTYEDINRTFQEIINVVDKRRQELLSLAKKIREDKHSVLEDQLRLIQSEKEKVEGEINSLQYQVEVKNITKKINELGEKTDSVTSLLDPRENCFIRFEHGLDKMDNSTSSAVEAVESSICDFGTIRTSKTFPSLCIASVIGKCSAHLRSVAIITAYDYNGQRQRYGGDPVSAEVKHEDGSLVPVKLVDNRDGTYEAHFIPPKGGTFTLKVAIFGRPIKTYPIVFDASDHINPLCIYGCRGPETHQFNQPVGLAVNPLDGLVYILDTGNGRIKVLSQSDTNNSPFTFVSHLKGNGLENKSATGITLGRECKSLLISNWRTKKITEIDLNGNHIRDFTHTDFVEPTYLTVNSRGEIIVADNGAKKVFIFHWVGKLARRIPNTANCDDTTSAAGTTTTSSPIATGLMTTGGKPVSSSRISLMSSASTMTSASTVTAIHHQSNSPFGGAIGAIAVGPDDDVIIADSSIHIFSTSGEKIREIFSEGRGRGHYGGIAVDAKGHLVATRIEKTKSFIQVFDYSSGQLKFVINSSEAKLKRPSSLATTPEFHAIVVDLGNDCIKKYRYH